MTSEGIFNFGPNALINNSFDLKFEYRGELEDWIEPTMIDRVKCFVKYVVDVLDINSTWSKYKKLSVVFEETESEMYDGESLDNGDEGVVKLYFYEVVEDLRQVLTTVAHELIHIRQFCDKRLRKLFDRVDGNVVGCLSWSSSDEKYYDNPGQMQVDDYRDLPWEIEAYALQDELVLAYESGVTLSKVKLE